MSREAVATPRPPVLDPQVRRGGGGRLLAGGSPARLVRLSAAGSAALDRLLAGTPRPGDEALAARLQERGLLHPVAGRLAEVSYVIPVRDGGDSLPGLVASLREWGHVVVVDDGSADGSAARAEAAGAEVLDNTSGSRGPGPARNLGLRAAATEFVAFVDADCRCPHDWARPLAGLLAANSGLLAAAPRVRSAAGPGAIARYERSRSPLDMGAQPALVGPGRRIPYVPSAALVVRREALIELGGFDPDLRFGEDVDLCWRALAAGFSIRYAPELEVEHRPRPSRAAFARQRLAYGGSAAALERRHPGATTPWRIDPAVGLVALAAAAAGVPAAALTAAGQVLWTATRRREAGAAPALASLAAASLAHSGRRLARAASRDWLPATLAVAVASRRARPYLALALAADAATAARRDPRLLGPDSLLLRALENASYAAGLWRGALRARSPGSLLPRLR